LYLVLDKQSVRSEIIKNLINIPGWRTRDHLVVFESDDWGSIRMPSNEVYRKLLSSGIDLLSGDGFRFNKYDTLETSEDLASLFDVLYSVKDSTDRHAVLTPFTVVANPDFDKIQQSGFSKYYFEPFTDTLKKYPGCENSFSLWKEGIEKRIFMPQFHGREHLNVKVWLKALMEGKEMAVLAFNNGMWGIPTADDPDIGIEFQAAFDFLEPDDLYHHKDIISSGLRLFKDLFGYSSTCFVPPNGFLSSNLEKFIREEGIKCLSVARKYLEPAGFGKVKKSIRWLGKRNKYGLVYLARNCFFEPNLPGKDWVDSCMKEIQIAYRWQKPAIIGSHRVNLAGGLDKLNRDKGLLQLDCLLKSIMKKWPDTKFITSSELGDLMYQDLYPMTF